MTPVILGFITGLILLVVGAESLVRGSIRLAIGFGITPLVAGLTVAAFGTSSPEFVVSLRASLAGSSGLALGNVVGSNICNVALILGLSALIRPLKVQVQVVRTDGPIMLLATFLLIVMLSNGVLGRIEGAILLAGLFAYVGWTIYQGRARDVGNGGTDGPRRRLQDYLLTIGGIALLILGGWLFVKDATILARELGISEAVIGLTMVAVGTSLPELATSAVASLRHQADVAVGNVVGSNIFNIFGILGAAALVSPLTGGDILPRDLLVLSVSALVLLAVARSGYTLSRIEGAVLVSGYAVYLVWLY